MTDADVDGSHIRTLLLTFFYRHMPALIENNFVYIAQPPLYRVTRKKTSRYIHSEKEMDDYLLELGISDIKMRLPNHSENLPTEKVKEILDLILEVEGSVSRIERKAVSFREFLGAKTKEGLYPRFRINLKEGDRFAYSADELEDIKKIRRRSSGNKTS